MLNTITDEALRALYWDDGLSGTQIANRLGCTPAAVSMRMKKSGIPTRNPHDYPPTEKQRLAWKANGKRLSATPESAAARSRNGRKNRGRRFGVYEFGGHEKKRSDGYIKVYVPDHPRASSDGYVMKHTLVMERHIGRFLNEDEVVHHVNHVRDDNRLENLRLMTKREHQSLHMRERHAERRQKSC